MGRRTCNVDKSQAEPFESHSREDVLNFARIQSGEERERQLFLFLPLRRASHEHSYRLSE